MTKHLLAAITTLLIALSPLGTGPRSTHASQDVAPVPCSSSPPLPAASRERVGRTRIVIKAPRNSVLVPPGGIQDAVNAHEPGTNFLLTPGTYSDGPVTPKNGDGFYGEGKVVWDGGNTQAQAFNSAGTKNVIVSGISFVHFNPPNQGGGIFNLNTGESMFTIEACEIAFNGGTPVTVGNGTRIFNSAIHDNNWVGIGGYQVTSVVVDHNEIYNNYLADISPDSPTGDASGMKFAKAHDVRVTNNIVRDNHGVGIWFDTDNDAAVIAGNLIARNSYRGIMVETSYGAIVNNNVISENGTRSGWIGGGGIVIANSSQIEAFNNILVSNAQGIIGYQQARGSGPQGPYLTRNNQIHDNFVTMADGITGFTMGAETDQSNRFYSNHYFLARPGAFIWGSTTDIRGWIAAGQDKDGTFDCVASEPPM